MKNVEQAINIYRKRLVHVALYYNPKIKKEDLIRMSNKRLDEFLNLEITGDTQMIDIYNRFKQTLRDIGENLSIHQSIGIGMSEEFKNVGFRIFGEDVGKIELIGPEVYFGEF